MGTDLSTAVPYQGRHDVSFTSVEEAQAGKGPEGQAAPAGTTPVAVDRNDTIGGLMSQAQPPMDWNNPADRAQFLADNPQFSETGGRNPDLIWPGEVVYIRTSPADGSTPPSNGTQAVGGPDAEGNYAFQNNVNGQPAGPQYPAQRAPNGQPTNSVTINAEGGEIRTDAQGMPLNGWAPAGEANRAGETTYVYYANGMPTTETDVRGMTEGPPSDPPAPASGNDMAGNRFGTGWFVTAGSSQGMALHYYVDGYQIDSPQVVNGRSDAPPPIIAPGTNAQLASE